MVLSVVILNNGEPKVIELTYQNLWRELKDMADTELIVSDNWFDALGITNATYVCFVEADCLVSSGYFKSMLGLFKKNKYERKLAMLTSATGVNNWANRFYGYGIGNNYMDGVVPNRDKKSTGVYPVQIGYVPGALIRATMLRRALEDEAIQKYTFTGVNLVQLSTALSFAFWRQGDGNRVHLAPASTYVTTEGYVNDIGRFDPEPGDLMATFKRESI